MEFQICFENGRDFVILSYVFFFLEGIRKKERSGDVEDVIVGWLVSWNMQSFEIVSVCVGVGVDCW